MFGGIPFGMFGDGMGGQSPPREPEPKKDIDNKKFYERLGVDPKATEDEIRRAFRKKSIREHPDKGGDPEKYKELTHMYEVLRDAKKRKIYDQFGEEGLENGGGASEFDFPGCFGSRRPRGPKKAKTLLKMVEVTLADVYKGIKKKMKITRSRICKECEGRGGKEDSVTECQACHGQGRIAKVVQMGFMISQTVSPCGECQGRGKVIKEKCKMCNARTVVDDVKVLELEITKGTPDGHRYTFNGEADEFPGVEAGDIVFEIQVKHNKTFHRKGADLYIDKEISLYEAISGVKFDLDLLDGKTIEISSPPGKIIGDGEMLCVEEQGMPFFGRSYKNGNLFVKFSVDFPTSLSKAQRKVILESLHGSTEPMADVGGAKEYKVQFYQGSEKELLAALRKRSMEENSDDDDMPQGARRVECQSQQFSQYH